MNAAPDQLRAFVERIIRLREEAAAIKADIREIYAEAKANGFDKTALGQLVSYVEKRAANPDKVAERSALFDLYLDAYDAGTGIALTHTHEDAA